MGNWSTAAHCSEMPALWSSSSEKLQIIVCRMAWFTSQTLVCRPMFVVPRGQRIATRWENAEAKLISNHHLTRFTGILTDSDQRGQRKSRRIISQVDSISSYQRITEVATPRSFESITVPTEHTTTQEWQASTQEMLQDSHVQNGSIVHAIINRCDGTTDERVNHEEAVDTGEGSPLRSPLRADAETSEPTKLLEDVLLFSLWHLQLQALTLSACYSYNRIPSTWQRIPFQIVKTRQNSTSFQFATLPKR